MTDGGADVYNIGRCGTEMMYFGTFFYKMDGGFMITASHNPSNYNGIKIVRQEGIPVSEDTGLKDIEELAFSGDFKESEKKGTVYKKEIIDDYVKHILTFVDMKKMKPLHIVVDAGNGCANVAFAPLENISRSNSAILTCSRTDFSRTACLTRCLKNAARNWSIPY